jgi:hypothetical protein
MTQGSPLVRFEVRRLQPPDRDKNRSTDSANRAANRVAGGARCSAGVRNLHGDIPPRAVFSPSIRYFSRFGASRFRVHAVLLRLFPPSLAKFWYANWYAAREVAMKPAGVNRRPHLSLF